MTHFFSDALLRLARPHLAWVPEQYEHFHNVVPNGHVDTDLAAGSARVADRELRVALLGTFAEDGTFEWGWAKSDLADTPAVQACRELREIGERDSVPELTETLVDLTPFPDPRLAADHLGIIAMGLLGARGLVKFGHGGRALTLLLVTDPGVPMAEPDPVTLPRYLATGAQLLPGPEMDAGLGYASTVVHGYAAHHGVAAQPVPGGVELTLAGGARLLVRISDRDLLEEVNVTVQPPEAPGEPAPAAVAEEPAPGPQLAAPFPEELLARLLPALAAMLNRKIALHDHLDDLGWRADDAPVWDPEAGVLRYGDLLDAAASEIGSYQPGPPDPSGQPGSGTWTWARPEWAGAAALRQAAMECGAERFAADRVDLGGTAPERHVAVLLARGAAALGEARALVRVPTPEGEHRYVAVTDPRIPGARSSPDVVSEVILVTANMLQQLVSPENRYQPMRSMVLSYFERCGIAPLLMDEPQMIRGMSGLYELRVLFSVDGTINDVVWGLQGTLG